MSRINVTASPLVYSHSLRDLYLRIGEAGWSVKKVKFDKKEDCYVASAKNPYGDEIEKTGPDEGMAVRNLLLAIERKNHMRSAAMERIGMWKANWVDQLQPIAEAYAKAPVYDPKAAAAFKALADDSMRRADVLRNQLDIEEVNDPEPYPHAQAMADDIHKRKHFTVSTANSEHPMWTPEQNTAFRIVHDVLGHGVSGGDFGWEGENRACQAHFPLLSPEAQKALFTECFTGETLVRTREGYRPIDQIKVGEYVLSGDGTFRRVLQTFQRDHDGELLEITTTSSLGPIRVTPEHPFQVLVGNHPRKSKKLPCTLTNCHKYPELHRFEWIEAGTLTENSYVRTIDFLKETSKLPFVSIPKEVLKNARMAARKGPTDFFLDDEFLWVIGMYLAEGSASRPKGGRLSFGLHRNEWSYLQRLAGWFHSQGYSTSVRDNSENGIELTVYSTTLATWWPQWLGKGCQNKAIPTEILNLPSYRLASLVEGVMDGDGHYPRNTLAQTSSILALQIAEISLRRGAHPSINIYPKDEKRTVYEVCEASADHCISRRRGPRGHWTIESGNAVKVTNIDRILYHGPVYDLEVEGDHSFVVQNLIVHNCIAQTAYGAHYRHFGPQKVALFPQFYEPAQQAEGVHPGFQGIHPSQTVAPTAMPAIKPSKPVGLPKNNIAPHEQEEKGMPVQMNYVPGVDIGKTGSVMPGEDVNPTLTDPNAGYQTGIQAMQPNAYLHHGDPLQAQDVIRNASLIDTEWAKLKTGENEPDYERMKLAIVNAFRAVLLSPRKDLYWNTIHYQDISGVPPGVTDPTVYWDALENKRQAWNVKNFGENARFSHRPYFKLIPQFERVIYDRNPQEGWEAAKERAQHELFDWEQEEQERLMETDDQLPKESRMNHFEIEKEANKALTKKLETFLAEHKAYDQPNLFTAAKKEPTQEDTLFPLEPQIKQPKLDRYGAFMGTHLKAIAQISTHVDALLKAALEDVHEHDGSGHHFRAAVMQLGVPGVGPKVASFAWLLLQPMTSQLATIDTHIMDVLGHNYEKDMNTRDYFKYERELQAGRDAAGYEHIPLGAFQWGIWDLKRTGEGSHQDHSGLRVIDPVPYNAIDWQAKEQPINAAQALLHKKNWHSQSPDWWKSTQPFRDQVGEEWDESIDSPKTQVPFQTIASVFKTAAVLRTPWLEHPQSGERLTGQPGETLMAHAVNTLHLTTPAVWAALGDDSTGKS